jgi:hypothetical protein
MSSQSGSNVEAGRAVQLLARKYEAHHENN